MRNFYVLKLWLVSCLVVGSITGASGQSGLLKEAIPSAPESRIYDPDRVYRTKPEVLARMSERLKKLKADYDFDVYMIFYSGLIGKDVVRLADEFHQAWLDERSDGLVFVMDVQSAGGGNAGRSRKLYNGDFIAENLMPRIQISVIEDKVKESSLEMQKETDVLLSLEVFIEGLTERISKQLEIDKSLNPVKEDAGFMGIMAIGLLIIGLVIAIIAKLQGRAEKAAALVYRLPDFLVGERLGAPNGGGKISWTDYGSPSGQ
jgi:hypothetical protein